ncbi:SSI family serine proteinase inhibitor [Streptomyces sp. NPDC001530]|uniref:SSI family serine proteinase inhibitor n=1 Tax=Streptomyces sp. NPDC001530 TaxID=3364582 RepID=UPI0036C49D09
MLRRLVLTAAASATAALSAVPAASAAPVSAAPVPAVPPSALPTGLATTGLATTASGEAVPAHLALRPPPARGEDSGDRLTVTVHGVGGDADETYELRCHPAGGSHPDAGDACRKLDGSTTWGKDPFAPVPPDALCTMQHGGPATAYVTGTWAGRPVDARFDRTDGCEIARWDALVPVLPGLHA